MRRRPFLLAALAAIVLVPSASAVAAPPPAQATPALPPAVVNGNTLFAQELYGKLAKDPGNIFFSPASISTALAMAWAGAGGDTAKQMAKTLHFDLPAKDHHQAYAALLARLTSSGPDVPQLAIANRVWAQKGMKVEPDFLAITKDRYGAPLESLDFAGASEPSRETINTWVEQKTNGKIKDLIQPGALSSATQMVLTNAIWFKGSWATAFDKKETHDEPFAAPAGSKKVPMMHATLHASYAEVEGAQVLELPYKSKDPERKLSMIVVLPKESIGKLEASMKLATWTNTLAAREVVVSLPKFSTTKSLGLADMLASMGMPLAFDAVMADFTGITKASKLHISKVIHKAFVDVNEEGTEAAAATAIVMDGDAASVPLPKVVFKADRPFLFYIRDAKTGSVLFLGRMNEPGA